MSVSRPPNKPTTTLWTSLVKYYRACLDHERELTLYAPTDPNGRVLLHNLEEHLITNKAITTILSEPEHTRPVMAYLNRRGRGIGGTFVYGFPLARVGERLYPICYTEVRMEPGSAPQTVVLSRGVSELLFNRYFLHAVAGLNDHEITSLQRALLSPKSKGPASVLNQFLLEVDLVYDAVLFGSEATPVGRGPGRELQLMEQLRTERLPDALRVFTGEQRIPSVRPTDDFLTILPADPAQLTVLQKRKAPFLVVAGPAGSGKSQTAANLIASALTEGKKVLYIGGEGQVPPALRQGFPGILSIGDQETWADSLRQAQGLIEALQRQTAGEGGAQAAGEEPSVLLAESQRLATELDRLVTASLERQQLSALLPELEAVEAHLTEVLDTHPLRLWIERLAQQVTPANADQFAPNQFLAIRELRVQALGWELDGGSLSGRMREMMRTNQIKAALRQAGLPDFCHPEGDLKSQVAGLTRLEQAFPLLLIRARQLRTRSLTAGDQTLAGVEEQIAAIGQAKVAVDQRRLRAAWQDRWSRMKPKADHLLTVITQELEALGKVGAQRAALRRQRFPELMEAFPVILSPNLAVAGMVPNEPELFDLLILDDASLVDLPSFLPVLYRAKQVVILGDEHGPRTPNRLGTDADSRLLGQVEEWNLAPFAYTEVSALHRALALLSPNHTVRLTRQYRAAPALVAWWSQAFYGGAVESAREAAEMERLLLADVADGETFYPAPAAISQAQNALEAKEVARQITLLIGRGITDLVVLTPFRGQALLLRRLLQRLSEVQPDQALASAIGKVPVLRPEELDRRCFQVAVISLVVTPQASPRTVEWLEQNGELLLQMLSAALESAIIVGHRERLASAGPLLASLIARTGEANPVEGASPPVPLGLQGRSLGFLASEQAALKQWLTLPGLDPEAWNETEQALYRRLTSLVRGRPVLIAPRLPLFTVVAPGQVRGLSPELLEAAVDQHLLFTLVSARDLKPIAAINLESESPGAADAICREAGLPLLWLSSGKWEGLDAITSLLPNA